MACDVGLLYVIFLYITCRKILYIQYMIFHVGLFVSSIMQLTLIVNDYLPILQELVDSLFKFCFSYLMLCGWL